MQNSGCSLGTPHRKLTQIFIPPPLLGQLRPTEGRLPKRYRSHRVFYEDVVENPEREIRRLLDYCGLPFEPACLRFHENARQARTASSDQVRRPIFSHGVEQCRNYEPWLGPLKDAPSPVLDAYRGIPTFGQGNRVGWLLVNR